jgi:hypothetical protein
MDILNTIKRVGEVSYINQYTFPYKKKELCVKLAIYENCKEMYGQQNKLLLILFSHKQRFPSYHSTLEPQLSFPHTKYKLLTTHDDEQK